MALVTFCNWQLQIQTNLAAYRIFLQVWVGGFDVTKTLTTKNNTLISGLAFQFERIQMFVCIRPEVMHRSPSEPLWTAKGKSLWASSANAYLPVILADLYCCKRSGRIALLASVGLGAPPGMLLHYYFCSFPAHFTPWWSGGCSRTIKTSAC